MVAGLIADAVLPSPEVVPSEHEADGVGELLRLDDACGILQREVGHDQEPWFAILRELDRRAEGL
jgi:hypothetical protein